MTDRLMPFAGRHTDPNPARDVVACPWCGCVDIHRDIYGVRCRDCGAERSTVAERIERDCVAERSTVAERIERDRTANTGGPRIDYGC